MPAGVVVRGLLAALLVASAAGCERDAAPDPLAASGLPSYAVSEAPVLFLEEDGTPEKLFSRIAARRMPGGEIVVADQGTSAIHVFGRDGRVLRQLARRGDGPGELRGDFLLSSHGDTIFAFGRPLSSRREVSVFTAGQGFLSRIRPEAPNAPSGMVVLDRVSTGHFVVEWGRGFEILRSLPEAGTLTPDSVTYGLLPLSAGEERGDVLWLPAVIRGWRFGHERPNSRIATGLSAYTLGPTTQALASGDRLWLIDSDSGQLRALDGMGREVVATRLSLEPQPYDRERLERNRARELGAAARALDSSRVSTMYDPDLLPPTAPLLSAAYAGAAGEVWVRLFDLDGDAPQRFVVVDRDGAEVARATLPAGLEVQQIGADFVIGIRRDSLGVESVHEHALRRQ